MFVHTIAALGRVIANYAVCLWDEVGRSCPNVWGVVSVVAARVFSVSSINGSWVGVITKWLQMTLGGKNCSASGPGIVVAIRPVPRAQSIAREKLNPTCFTRCKRSTLVLHPADSKNRRRTASGISFTYDLSTLFNNLFGILPGILATEKWCCAPRGYWWVSSVTSINCNVRVILRPVHSVMSLYISL
jgi:hypothetical protein